MLSRFSSIWSMYSLLGGLEGGTEGHGFDQTECYEGDCSSQIFIVARNLLFRCSSSSHLTTDNPSFLLVLVLAPPPSALSSNTEPFSHLKVFLLAHYITTSVRVTAAKSTSTGRRSKHTSSARQSRKLVLRSRVTARRKCISSIRCWRMRRIW